MLTITRCKGRLHVPASAESCYFCVFTQKDFKVEKIIRDDKFISAMLQKLNTCYRQHFEKALLQKYVYRHFDKYLRIPVCKI